ELARVSGWLDRLERAKKSQLISHLRSTSPVDVNGCTTGKSPVAELHTPQLQQKQSNTIRLDFCLGANDTDNIGRSNVGAGNGNQRVSRSLSNSCAVQTKERKAHDRKDRRREGKTQDGQRSADSDRNNREIQRRKIIGDDDPYRGRDRHTDERPPIASEQRHHGPSTSLL